MVTSPPTRSPHERCRAHEGRRSKAAKEGRRGLWGTRSAGAMEIWLTPSEHRGRHATSSPLADEHRHAFAAQGGIKFGVAKGMHGPCHSLRG
jgi:hypothetical protein